MSKNLQFLDDPDDVPYINETITLHVGVGGSDESNTGSKDSPFRSLGKAIDVVRNKIIGKENLVTIQLGAIQTDKTGYGQKKYFEEEKIKIDFESAKRIKIKGVKPTDHEVVGISYYDKATDRDGYYCQVLVTNQDKINIGDYIGIYDHVNAKKKDPSHFWIRNNIFASYTRMINPNNCYAEAIRPDMILGVHEVVDVGPSVKTALPTELFEAEGLEVGVVTLHIKSCNHTYDRLDKIPYYSGIGMKNGKAILQYVSGANSSTQIKFGTSTLPPVFYGAEVTANPDTLQVQGEEQFYFSGGVQMIEIVDILVRGYGYSLSPLDGKLLDHRPGRGFAKDATLLWNDPTLTRHYRVLVANKIASYFYKKIIEDLRIDGDLPIYFGKSSDPILTIEQYVNAAKKVRDFLLDGAKNIEGVPTWDEGNHPDYGYGPFDTGVFGNPLTSTFGDIDKTSYPPEYGDSQKVSFLLQSYNIYPPINGQMYGPILVKRISRWYNDKTSSNGLQLDRWSDTGFDSSFFCGFVTPQGWYKERWISDPQGRGGNFSNSIYTLQSTETEGEAASDGLTHGYWEVFGGNRPIYAGNSQTNFNSIVNGAIGPYSNDKTAPAYLAFVDENAFNFAGAGITSNPNGHTGSYVRLGTMGSAWYSGSVNNIALGEVSLGKLGPSVLDKYSLGYGADQQVRSSNDRIVDKNTVITTGADQTNLSFLYSSQTTILRAKCYKTVLRFGKDGICVTEKTKLGLLKDLCIVGISQPEQGKMYGILCDHESVLTASNIAVAGFAYGISAKRQSLINLIADLGSSTIMTSPIDPAAIVSDSGIGIMSTIKSHINARRTVSAGSKLANYFAAVNSSMDCSNTMSVCSFKHGYVCDFNSYMKATNAFSEFNKGVGFCAANNSILVCHRSRSIWNGEQGVLAQNKSQIKALEFICRSNDADGFLAKNKSVIMAGQNSTNYPQYRQEILKATDNGGFPSISGDRYYGLETSLPPFMFRVLVEKPGGGTEDVYPTKSINSNPIHGTSVILHECNSTISEFNAGSGFAADGDSTIIADNTISRYNSKRYGEFFLYGWSGTRTAYATDTYCPTLPRAGA